MSAKIKLSKDELLLVQDQGIFLTKNAIVQKVMELFGDLSDEMREEIKHHELPEAVSLTMPKISKGENYLGLPYVMLDYPRFFSQESIFAIRSFFWWGNYFSITLHLQGIYKEMFAPIILQNISLLKQNGFFVCISPDPWKHEMSMDNYIPLLGITENEITQVIQNKPFLKLSAKTGFDEWENTASILLKRFREILKAMDKS